MPSSERKPFTAELQLMKQRDRQASAQPHHHGPSLLEVCRSIEDMRLELKALREDVRGGRAAVPPPREEEEPVRTHSEVSTLKTELRALAFCIEQTKTEIAALRSDGAEVDHLNDVASELDAVVSALEASPLITSATWSVTTTS